jgi:hypothetical protein
MNEVILIIILMVASILIYYCLKIFAKISLHPFSLILLWPIVLATVNNYGNIIKIFAAILVIPAIYLISKSIQNAKNTQA